LTSFKGEGAEERRGEERGPGLASLEGSVKEALASFSRGGEREARSEGFELFEKGGEELFFAGAFGREAFESEEEEKRFELREAKAKGGAHERPPKRARPPPASSCQSEEGARAKREAAEGSAPLERLRRSITARPEKPARGARSNMRRSLRSPSMQSRRAGASPSASRRRFEGRGAPFGRRMGTAREKPWRTASSARLAPPGLSAAREAVV